MVAQRTPLDDLLSRLNSVLSEQEEVHKQAVALLPPQIRHEGKQKVDERYKAKRQSGSKTPSA